MRFMKDKKQLLGGLIVCMLMAACGNNTSNPTAAAPAGGDSSGIKEETISFPADSANLHAFVVYSDSIKGKRPAVIVIPEWWGLNDYPKMRARMLAKLGYVAMALDIYGDGKVAETPDSAMAYAGPFYAHPEKAKARIDAAIARLRTYDNVDTAEIGAAHQAPQVLTLDLRKIGLKVSNGWSRCLLLSSMRRESWISCCW